MKKLLLVSLVVFSISGYAQDCETKIKSSSTKKVLGNQVVNVNIMNIATQAFDRIDYTVISYDIYDKKLGEESFFWQVGSLTHPIKNGETLHDIHSSKYVGASSIKTEIDNVHYINGQTCGQ
jgi:hypothetical protein